MSISKLICRACNEPFVITEADRLLLQKLAAGQPTLCPDCRQQRRTAQVNQIFLFKRVCDATRAAIVTNYPPNSAHKVFSQEHWWSDAFDASVYGREYDLSRSFFDQFHELSLEVPRPALFTDYTRDVNSEYTNYAGPNKNCYLLFDGQENENCYYSFGIDQSLSSTDCYRVQNLQLCCHATDCSNCYGCVYAVNSESCSECAFISNCIGCKYCIMCSNLTHKEYYYRNRPITPELYARLKKDLASGRSVKTMKAELGEFRRGFPQKFIQGARNDDVSGDHLRNCKNAHHCYDSSDLRDCAYCTQAWAPLRDCLDCHECGDAELLYECAQLGYGAYNLQFSMHCLRSVSDLCYSNYCFSSSNLFGCVGLKRRKHCILNKQYSPADYNALRGVIIGKMLQSGEWGEFFPIRSSAFPYNITVAQELYPLTRSEALAKGFAWYDFPARAFEAQKAVLPDAIGDVADDILRQILTCSSCCRDYRIIPQELSLYRSAGLALPDKCFLCRHHERLLSRNPRHLWDRNCSQCNASITTSYAPARPEMVYCEPCYASSLI